jgi:hypothetical protein
VDRVHGAVDEPPARLLGVEDVHRGEVDAADVEILRGRCERRGGTDYDGEEKDSLTHPRDVESRARAEGRGRGGATGEDVDRRPAPDGPARR